MSAEEHREAAEEEGVIRVAILTVSDTRTAETDHSGQLIRERMKGAGHVLVGYRIVRDEPDEVEAALDALVVDAQIVVVNGGTGVSRRDRTFDVISRKLEKTLPGFGEIFRMLSYEEIGAAAMLSRATAGVYRGAVVFSTPGSTNAVRLALDTLILSEMKHLAWELAR